MARRRKTRKRRIIPLREKCPFCEDGKEPYWRDYQALAEFLSPRSRILSRLRTGVCATHQRRLTETIKHCRHLGLLPFITRVK